MMLKLVHDADTADTITLRSLSNIPSMARGFADDLEAGEWGDVTRAIVLVENEDGIVILGWGDGCTAYELMGLFEAAKLKAFADDFCGD